MVIHKWHSKANLEKSPVWFMASTGMNNNNNNNQTQTKTNVSKC